MLVDCELVDTFDSDYVFVHYVHDPVGPGAQPVVAAAVESLRRPGVGGVG
jgi:hypothetical protein